MTRPTPSSKAWLAQGLSVCQTIRHLYPWLWAPLLVQCEVILAPGGVLDLEQATGAPANENSPVRGL